MNFNKLYDLTALEIFRIIAPEFDVMDDAQVEKALIVGSMFIDEETYGKAYNVALALMTAHILSLSGGVNGGYSSSTQKVSSMKEGDLSLTYKDVSDGDLSWLAKSTYGQLLELLQKRLGLRLGMMVRGPVVTPCDLVESFGLASWRNGR